MAEFHIGPESDEVEIVSIAQENLLEAKRSALLIATLVGLLTWLILIIPLAIIVWASAV